MTCAERIEELRKKNNLSRRELALRAGISPTTLQSAIQRNGDISLDLLFPIAEVLNVNVVYLKDGFDVDNFQIKIKGKFEKIDLENFLVTTLDGEKKIIYFYCKLNEIGQQEAIKRVEELTRLEEYTATLPDAESDTDGEQP